MGKEINKDDKQQQKQRHKRIERIMEFGYKYDDVVRSLDTNWNDRKPIERRNILDE